MNRHPKLKAIASIVLAIFALLNLMAIPRDAATISQSIAVLILTKTAAILAFWAMFKINRT